MLTGFVNWLRRAHQQLCGFIGCLWTTQSPTANEVGSPNNYVIGPKHSASEFKATNQSFGTVTTHVAGINAAGLHDNLLLSSSLSCYKAKSNPKINIFSFNLTALPVTR
jgi:hypothetical protein